MQFRFKSNVRHFYIYPNKYEEDFEIFYTCPMKKRFWVYVETQKDLTYINCLKHQRICESIGYVWFCHSCHLEQLTTVEEKTTN